VDDQDSSDDTGGVWKQKLTCYVIVLKEESAVTDAAGYERTNEEYLAYFQTK